MVPSHELRQPDAGGGAGSKRAWHALRSTRHALAGIASIGLVVSAIFRRTSRRRHRPTRVTFTPSASLVNVGKHHPRNGASIHGLLEPTSLAHFPDAPRDVDFARRDRIRRPVLTLHRGMPYGLSNRLFVTVALGVAAHDFNSVRAKSARPLAAPLRILIASHPKTRGESLHVEVCRVWHCCLIFAAAQPLPPEQPHAMSAAGAIAFDHARFTSRVGRRAGVLSGYLWLRRDSSAVVPFIVAGR